MPRNALRVYLLLLAVAALYWPDTATLVGYWLHKDVNGSSAIFIAVLAGFLLFRIRGRLGQVSVGPVPWACVPLAACAAASLICWRAGIQALQLLFLPPILWLAVLGMFGVQAARLVAVGIGFLYFALPGSDLLNSALQYLTAWAVGVIGPTVGLPIAMSGTTASLPGGVTFAIERVCSGLDFLTVGVAVAILHGELEGANLCRRAGLVVGMALLAIVSNWLRVILIIAVGYLSHMRSALATSDHLAFGWVVFACALLLFVWVAARGGSKPTDASGARDPSGGAGSTTHRGGAVWRYGMVAATGLAVPVLVYAGPLLSDPSRAHATTLELPLTRPPWHDSADPGDSLWQPKFAGARAERRARYESEEGRTVEVVAFGFPEQTQAAKILKESNSLLGDRGLSAEAITLARSAGIPYGEVIAVDPGGRRSLIWSVVDIGGRLFGNPLYSQLWYGARSLVGTPYSALFALRTRCDSSCDAARAVLAEFLRANGPALFASVPDSNTRD